MNDAPLVSAIVPTHNRPSLLAEALASVRAQTFTDYEIIVVSNGETADNRVLSQACASRYGACYFAIDRGNVSAARNAGISAAKGRWLAFLDDDDLWLPNKLELQLAEAERTGADMIECTNLDVSPDGSERPAREIFPQSWPHLKALCHQLWIPLPSNVLITKAAVDAVGGFDEKQIVNEDCELWRRVLWRHRAHRMPDVLTRRRIGHVSLSGNNLRTYRYELRHHIKMWFDTPDDLRWAIPRLRVLILRPIIKIIMPRVLRHPRKSWEALQLRRPAR